METKVVSAHIPLSLVEKVDALAASIERPRDWVVKEALAAWIEKEEERYAMTLEALDSVDAGTTVPHEDVVTWANRLGTDDAVSVPKARNR